MSQLSEAPHVGRAPRPEPVPPRWRRMVAPSATIGGLALATVALHLRDPHERGSWGFCPSAALGFWCPGCGGLRAVNDLTNGDIAAAASSNLLLVLTIPVVVLLLVSWARDRWVGRSREPDARLITIATVAFCTVGVLFGVLRNLPAGSWLAP
ncbi:DUF2752 domain-containing protein [Nocardioides ferulae]|uniref:DUF2752 domain-containing protein n=1 Tax=Nocardioides ferulae TaxID=2340821 RepID=UPI00197D34FC|nr:DUF2752 domain-containing protein [Nocardioides ferulae]